MIAPLEAEAIARAALAERLGAGDPLFAPWQHGTVGTVVAVYDVGGPQSYWLVPLVLAERVIGFVRIELGGSVEAMGVTCRGPEMLERCPEVVTGITAAEAMERVRAGGSLAPGDSIAPPRFVHDGPRGREAWLVESASEGVPRMWFFVSSAGLYVRSAGVRHSEDPFID
jgi:hypothetical protein